MRRTRRPFRTYKMMKPLPVAEATGYTTVPLQGTGQHLNQKPARGVAGKPEQDPNKNPGGWPENPNRIQIKPRRGEVVKPVVLTTGSDNTK
jgi:hypothetical protein